MADNNGDSRRKKGLTLKRKFLVALHFEANVEIEAENEEDAKNKGQNILNARHVYEDKKISELVGRAYADGLLSDGNAKVAYEFSDPDFICDSDPVVLEEIKG